MDLLKKIEEELKDVLKAGDRITADTLRMLKTDITYEKAKKGEDLTDEKILEVIARAAKKRKEAIGEYLKASRKDLADKEALELKVIERYLPELMSLEEIEKHISQALDSIGTVTKKDFGRVMGQIMKDLKGKADGQAVKEILNRILE